MFLYILLGVLVIILFILFILFTISSSKLKRVVYKINEAEYSIKQILVEKYTIISKIDKSIKKQSDTEHFKGLYDINVDDLDSFELNKKLSKYDNIIKELSDYNKDLKYEEEEIRDFEKLNSININRLATEKFYNDNVVIYNELIEKFPSNIIARLKGYEEKDNFSNEKEEMFEILKN